MTSAGSQPLLLHNIIGHDGGQSDSLTSIDMPSSITETRFGPIEYAVRGDGYPVLVSHGAAGGLDQALLVAQPLLENGFRIIAVSRDGYLRAPLSSTSTPLSQADKYASLLDALGVQTAVILAVSVGGPSAIEFALKHSSRCKALVLVSAIVRSVRPAYLGMLPEQMVLRLLKSRTYPRLLARMPDGLILRIFGVTGEEKQSLLTDQGAHAALRQILQDVKDTSGQRSHGNAADAAAARHLPLYPFQDLAMPVLAVHGAKDRFAPIHYTRKAIALVPHGEMVEVPNCGHLCIVTQRRLVFREILRFLNKIERG